jgi:hypothetical protein
MNWKTFILAGLLVGGASAQTTNGWLAWDPVTQYTNGVSIAPPYEVEYIVEYRNYLPPTIPPLPDDPNNGRTYLTTNEVYVGTNTTYGLDPLVRTNMYEFTVFSFIAYEAGTNFSGPYDGGTNISLASISFISAVGVFEVEPGPPERHYMTFELTSGYRVYWSTNLVTHAWQFLVEVPPNQGKLYYTPNPSFQSLFIKVEEN